MRKLFLLLIIIPLTSSCDADVINKLTGYGEKKKETVEEKKKKAKNMLDEVSGMLMIDTSNELIKDEFEEIEPKDVEIIDGKTSKICMESGFMTNTDFNIENKELLAKYEESMPELMIDTKLKDEELGQYW